MSNFLHSHGEKNADPPVLSIIQFFTRSRMSTKFSGIVIINGVETEMKTLRKTTYNKVWGN